MERDGRKGAMHNRMKQLGVIAYSLGHDTEDNIIQNKLHCNKLYKMMFWGLTLLEGIWRSPWESWGSLVFNRAGRLWRVSPIFLIVEDIVICFRLYEGIWELASKSNLQICSCSLLALREGNFWSQDEYEQFQRTEYKPKEEIMKKRVYFPSLKGMGTMAEGR